MRHALADVLLAIGVLFELGAVAGTVAMHDAYERLHFAPAASIGAIAIAASVFVASGPSTIALKAILLAAFIVLASPVLAHFTARAIREWDRGDWRPSGDEIDEGGPR